MKIARETVEGINHFSGYGEGYVEVNGVRHGTNVAVASDRVLPAWLDGPLASLTPAHVEALVAAGPEVVLLGTGASLRFPPPELLAPLYRARIGVEVMDTKAACRTYNILLAEGRRVMAALIVE